MVAKGSGLVLPKGVEVRGNAEGRGGGEEPDGSSRRGGSAASSSADVLSLEALGFLADLHRAFNPRREELLKARAARQARLDSGERPDFLRETKDVREGSWNVAPVPEALRDRRVEITGPVDRKMMINALNSGAKVFMADFEDSLSPTWSNVTEGHANLMDAVDGTLSLTTAEKEYRLDKSVATLVVRPRGWHLPENHILVDGKPVSASLADMGLFLFHSAKRFRRANAGPWFYLPKMENHLEARLWNDVFAFAEQRLGLRTGAVKATVLVETILAAFEMEEILYELRERSAGENAGRWDYIFSVIKKFRNQREFLLPDRAQVTMASPFMRAYARLLVRTCHRRGAHAIGGMAAFVPNRRDPAVTEMALAKVREDKVRESEDGFDGTWVAHPDLVPVAMEIFDRKLGQRPNQLDAKGYEGPIGSKDLLDVHIPGGTVTERGVRTNVDVGVQYIEAWLRGTGAVALHNLMEDAATAEISRSQLWQWIRHGANLDDGRAVTRDLVRRVVDEEVAKLSVAGAAGTRFPGARRLFEQVALGEGFDEFLTLPAYERLTGG